jgi:hypothetical protein
VKISINPKTCDILTDRRDATMLAYDFGVSLNQLLFHNMCGSYNWMTAPPTKNGKKLLPPETS